MNPGMVMADFRQSKNWSESRDHCTVQGGIADMYKMRHNSRCVCLCPARPLFSSMWPLYNQEHDPVMPKWHHHRLLALSGNYNPLDCVWKSYQILEYKGKDWVVVTKMPNAIRWALFQVKSFDVVQAWSHESRVFIKRVGDGQINGAVYDLEKNTWGTEWRVPADAVPWLRGVYLVQELSVPWERYMTTCLGQLPGEKLPEEKLPDLETLVEKTLMLQKQRMHERKEMEAKIWEEAGQGEAAQGEAQ